MLMDHNIPIYEKFEAMLEEHSKVILITATGTGKSYIIAEYLESHNMTALVVCPKVSICNNWIKITNKVQSITYHKMSNLAKSFIDIKKLVSKFDLIVFDEAHHIGSKYWTVPFLQIEDIINDGSDIKLIGVTASSRRFLDNDRDIAFEYFDGNIVSGYSQLDAINAGILPSAEYIISIFNSKEIYDRYRDKVYKSSALIGQLDYSFKNATAIEDILIKHLTVDTKKGIIFVDRIASIEFARKTIKSVFKDCYVCEIHSNFSKEKNNNIIDTFEAKENGFIIAVDMLNEGLHIRGINTVIMLRHTMSPMVYMQQIGRGLAANSNKLFIFDFVANVKSLRTIYRHEECIDYISSVYNNSNDRKSSDQIIIHDYLTPITEVLESIDKKFGYNNFTDEDIKIIIENYKSPEDINKIANILDRPRRSIYYALKRHGLYQYTPNFSEEEDELIRKYYPIGGSNEAAKYINKPINQIRNRAKLLGVTREPNWSTEEDQILINNYPTLGINGCAALLNDKTISSIKNRAKKFKLCSNNRNIPYTKEEDEIICKYYSSLGAEGVAKMLPNRNANSIKSRANIHLNIYLDKNSSKDRWTLEEEEIIIDAYNKGGLELAAKMLPNRTKSSIGTRLKKLNIKKDFLKDPWTIEEEQILKDFYYEEGRKCFDRIKSKNASQCKRKVRLLNLKTKKDKAKWTKEEVDELIKFIETNGMSSTKIIHSSKSPKCCYQKAKKLGY